MEGEIKNKNPFAGFYIIIVLIVLALGAIYFSKGFYTVQPNEQALIKRFGAYHRMGHEGLNFKLPYPFEDVFIVDVEQIRRMEIGYKTIDSNRQGQTSYRSILEESLMLTGDENIIDIDFSVQYSIRDAKAYVFNVKDVEDTIKKASESSMRQTIGERNIDDALTEKKGEIERDAKFDLQKILDIYNVGILVREVKLQDVLPPSQVIEDFKAVASAKENSKRLTNDAEAYRLGLIPKVEGEVAKMINQAEGEKAKIIDTAKGDTAKFENMLKEYRNSKEITKKRLYYETMIKKLEKVDKIIINESKDSGIFDIFKILNSNMPGGKK
ncbi:MAG: FtsH protease activity modulator HflK [Candidatus Muirbacterium halophilum]|nr:FtsH protease activity modulator HflK [Candidatus Muirbacterium halophilum]MCK9475163.1 FtsH protease activity modulator HflK [Candidatus Muirbacterium halophilum]